MFIATSGRGERTYAGEAGEQNVRCVKTATKSPRASRFRALPYDAAWGGARNARGEFERTRGGIALEKSDVVARLVRDRELGLVGAEGEVARRSPFARTGEDIGAIASIVEREDDQLVRATYGRVEEATIRREFAVGSKRGPISFNRAFGPLQ